MGDDTTRLQAIIDSDEAVPAGSYRLTAPLVLRSGSVVEGSRFRVPAGVDALTLPDGVRPVRVHGNTVIFD